MYLFYVTTRPAQNIFDLLRYGMNSTTLQLAPPPDINFPNPSVDQIPSANHPSTPPPTALNIPIQIAAGHLLPKLHLYGPPKTITAIGSSDYPDRGYVLTFTPIKEADISVTNMMNSWAPFAVLQCLHATSAM